MPRLRPCCEGTSPRAPLSSRRWRRPSRRCAPSRSKRLPRPSAVLALRLDLERAARLSTDRPHVSTAVVAQPREASTPRRGRRRVALGAFAGLGLAAKITIGAVAATAVGVAGAGAAGAVGGLPAPAQEVFEQVTGQHPGGEQRERDRDREQRVRSGDRRGGASEGGGAASGGARERRGAAPGRARQRRGGEPDRRRARRGRGRGRARERRRERCPGLRATNGLETAGEKANADLPEQGGSNEAEEAKERD